MKLTRRGSIGVLGASLAGLALRPAFADGTVVDVELWDMGENAMDMAGDMPMKMHMPGSDMPMAPMGVKLSRAEVPAGEVTFKVTNSSKDFVHEMVVSPLAGPSEPPPYNADMDEVDEDKAGNLGEVEDLDPGQSGQLTITLKPGSYILYCNIPGHYAHGMWAELTVTG